MVMLQNRPVAGGIALVGLGGTISMTVGEYGASPAFSAAEVAALDPGSRLGAAVNVARVGGSEVDLDHLALLEQAVRDLAGQGARGVVVTTGTDSIEEVSAWLAFTGPWPVPIVVTGSMVPGGEPGSDGALNLELACAAVDLDLPIPLVAFAGKIFQAGTAQKISGTELDAFGSPGHPPIARWSAGAWTDLQPPAGLPGLGPSGPRRARVEIVTAYLGCDGAQLLDAAARSAAVVVAANGAGNLPPALAVAAVDLAAEGFPVFITTRAHDARTAPTYAYPGGGARLVAAGLPLISGLTAHQLRILLAVALSQDTTPAAALTLLRTAQERNSHDPDH